MNAQKKFAVFDVDGTIVRTSLFLQIVDRLIANGHLPADSRQKLDEKLDAYKTRQHAAAFDEYAGTSVKLLFDNIHTLSVTDYLQAVQEVVTHSRTHTYVYTRDLIKDLKQQGYFLIALSGSEMKAVEQFTAHYGFDVAVGEIYQEANGRFTGEYESVFHQKDIFLKQLVAKYDLTFEGSVAIGDTSSDAKMLALVEKPIAFNPEERLLKQAREHGWKIVIERKNVIYELESRDGSYLLAQTNVS